MNSHLRGRAKALLAFALIAALVIGGLGWVTIETLHLEEARAEADFEKEQSEQRAPRDKEQAEQTALFEKELSGRLGLALWRLDSRVAPALAREDSRPYDHYGAFFAPAVLFRTDGTALKPGEVVEQSPLVNAELPDWMLLHFQTDAEQGWASPQVLSQKLQHLLKMPKERPIRDEIAEQRQQVLLDLSNCGEPHLLLDQVKLRCVPAALQPKSAPTTTVPATTAMPGPAAGPMDPALNNYRPNLLNSRNTYNQQDDMAARALAQERLLKETQAKKVQTTDLDVALSNVNKNGEGWFLPKMPRPVAGQKAEVKLSPMVPLWLTPQEHEQRLVVARLVKIGDKQICQGIVLDWVRLQAVLADEVGDLFPQAHFVPMRAPKPPHPERTMKWLPVELDPGPTEEAPVAAAVLPRTPPELPDWTPSRVGLALAWLAALVALLAVGLGGSSLLALSERRIRFVSAVTHELRTPLTTLRLYLDMLTGGMVQSEEQRSEYLRTLNDEADRLNRLVANVLDFSRLERQRPRLELSAAAPAELLEQLRTDWQDRCRNAGKELVVENTLPDAEPVTTDVKLVQQVVGNLIDNACKYSRSAEDKRIWLRARREGKRLVLEVEDRGPGVALRERRSIFRAFRRGRDADVTAGGVGLGLALARQWARLLGGRLVLGAVQEGSGACFRLELSGLRARSSE